MTVQTLVRFCGALILGGIATAIDHPGTLRWRPSRAAVTASSVDRAVPQRPGAVQRPLRLGPGKRAYAVRLTEAAGLAQLVYPDSHIDLLAVLADTAHAGQYVAKVIVSNVRVLAVDLVVQPRPDGSGTRSVVLTVEVTPEEAGWLAIASAQGRIRASLRGR